jgi:hypothetical protein
MKMSYFIDRFVIYRLDGSISKKMIRWEDGEYRLLTDQSNPIPYPTYKLDKMLRHPKIYKISRININGLFYDIGGNFYDNMRLGSYLVGEIKEITLINNVAKFEVKTIIGNTQRLVQLGKHLLETLKTASNVTLMSSDKSVETVGNKVKAPKPLEEEECLSLKEIESIVGELDGCKIEILNYVKKKLSK